jgi:uncharacterized protein (TIGR02466 family)
MGNSYQISRLWNGVAPILTTNLIENGVVDVASNDLLTQAAVEAFDRYTNSATLPSSSHQEVVDDATSNNNRRRRRRRPSSHKNAEANRSIDINSEVGSESLLPTPNDNFFEYQRRNGYEILRRNQQTNDLLHELKEVHINNAIIHYLQQYHINSNNNNNENGAASNLKQKRLTNSIINELQNNFSPELSIDLWATVQRGKGAHHKFHVHDGALVSGVYYSSCPLGCAPLVLRRPTLNLDGKYNSDGEEEEEDEKVNAKDDDVIIHPRNGQLILFPPWLEHGVPMATNGQKIDPSLPRVSWAFNLTARLAYIGDAWDVTRPS